MQNNLKNNSAFFERIMQIINYYGIKNVNAFSKAYLGYNSPEKINRLKKEENKPSFDILVDIANKFDEINLDWLITGKGKMLKLSEKDKTFLASEEAAVYRKGKEEITFLRDQIKKLQQENADLIKIIQQFTGKG